MESQGYQIHTTVYQDSNSAILLEKNGKASSSKRTRHINIRYFFITDFVRKGSIHVEYCPTKGMVDDFFTKPLQGYLFQKLRSFIMNLPPPPPPSMSPSMVDVGTTATPSQECVGETDDDAGEPDYQGWRSPANDLLDFSNTVG
jgi:hypothetical protein